MFISSYARDNRWNEDLPESVVPWLAITLGKDRVPEDVQSKIIEAIPNRLDFFDLYIKI